MTTYTKSTINIPHGNNIYSMVGSVAKWKLSGNIKTLKRKLGQDTALVSIVQSKSF